MTKRSIRLTPRFFAAIAVLLMATPIFSFAGQQTGKVQSVTVRASDGLVLFTLEGNSSGKPPCATYSYWIIKNENSVAGKQQHATILSTKFAGRTVSVSGTNQCTRWGDGEDVDAITLID